MMHPPPRRGRNGPATIPLWLGCFFAAACADGQPHQAEGRSATATEGTNGGKSLSHRNVSDDGTGESSPDPAGAKALTGSQLEKLITGRTLWIRIPSMNRPPPRREHYKPGGLLEVQLDRVMVAGRYTIAGNRLCQSVPGEPELCRTIYRHEDGRYLIDDPRAPGAIYQIILE
jgi:hypothetical protein